MFRDGWEFSFRALTGSVVLSFGCAAQDGSPRAPETSCGCSVQSSCPAGFSCDGRVCMPEPKPVGAAAPIATAPPVTAPPKDTRLALDGTEVHELVSKTNGRAYQIVVAPPNPEPGKRFATVYVLDGNWDFPLVNAMRGSLQYDEAIPPVLIVGIGYAGPSPDIGALRASDLTPTAHPSRAESGKAPEFLRFVESELMPFIEARYPADPSHRVLAGASFAGLFTLYTLFERPELFSGYVSITPAVAWDDGWIVKREREFAKTKRDPLTQRLWVSFGDAEEPERVKRGREFIRELEGRRYLGPSLRARWIEGERHAGLKSESYNRGLRFVLAPLAPKPSK